MRIARGIVIALLGLSLLATTGCGLFSSPSAGQDISKTIIANQVLIQKTVQFGTDAILGAIKDDGTAVNAANSVASIADILTNATVTDNVSLNGLKDAAAIALGKTSMTDTSKRMALQVLDLICSTAEGIIQTEFATADADSKAKAVQALLQSAAAGAATAAVKTLHARGPAGPPSSQPVSSPG